MAQEVFKRIEKKYLINKQQYHQLLDRMKDYVVEDKYSNYTIRNIYFDTDNDELIRTSIDKPVYKEKFRVRCYNQPDENSDIFLEIKKKFDGVVYKRRVVIPFHQVESFLSNPQIGDQNPQIQQEIAYVLQHYNLKPRLYLAYDRVAFHGIEDKNFRITFDTNIRSRRSNLSLTCDDNVKNLLKPDEVLMEVKIPGAFPLWFSQILTSLGITNVSFSKYGMIYKNELAQQGGKIYAGIIERTNNTGNNVNRQSDRLRLRGGGRNTWSFGFHHVS
ncbi:MAG: polyphosphate polymerase domain-containing protein [Lachnospiraceae bacterium]|nr:polyphosphate polymerase domain-containing protein [Lachnospiraceae bacterium]